MVRGPHPGVDRRCAEVVAEAERVADFVGNDVFQRGVHDALGLFRVERVARPHGQQIERETRFVDGRIAVGAELVRHIVTGVIVLRHSTCLARQEGGNRFARSDARHV